MNYMTPQEAAEQWNVSLRRVQFLCLEGRIPGARRIDRRWKIPASAPYPPSRRGHAKAQERAQTSPGGYFFPLPLLTGSFASRAGLGPEEQALLDAQILMARGDNLECIRICRKLADTAKSPAAEFGVHFTILYASLTLGLYYQIVGCMERMMAIRLRDPQHDADYQLLIAMCRFQYTYDTAGLDNLNLASLSADALIAYECFLFQTYILNPSSQNDASLRAYSAMCKGFEDDGVLPAAFVAHATLAWLYGHANGAKASQAHLERACHIAYEQGFVALLTKYSSLGTAAYRDCLSSYDSGLARTISARREREQRSWRALYNAERGNPIPLDYTSSESETLMLVATGMANKDIALAQDTTPEETAKAIERLCAGCGCKTKAELARHARQLFSTQEKYDSEQGSSAMRGFFK